MIRGKKAIAPVIFIGLFLAVIYIGLLLPIPAFKSMRMSINFFLVLGLWVILQIIIFYAYYKIGTLATKGVRLYKTSVEKWTARFKKWLTVH